MKGLNRWAWAWTFLAFTAGVVLPLFALFQESLSHAGVLLLWDPIVLSVTRATFFQASVSTLISILFGLPLGLWMGRWVQSFPQSRLPILLALPYGIPTLVAALSWIILLGRNGMLARAGFQLDWAYSLKAVILAHVFLNIPLVALWVLQARVRVPALELEAAKTLGATRFQLLRYVIWPRITWALASAGVQVFSLCAMSFALVLILGGGPPVQTLETLLFSHLRYGTLDIPAAAACGIWQLAMTLIPWVFVVCLRYRTTSAQSHFEKLNTQSRKPREGRKFLGLFLGGVAVFFVLPYLVIFKSFDPSFFRVADREWLPALEVSLKLAVLSSLLAVTTAVAAVLTIRQLKTHPIWQQVCEILFSLPSGISILVLALGFWLAYEKWIDPFEGSMVAMVALQATLFFPFAYRILWPVSAQVKAAQLEAAFTLGASPFQSFWYVEWPRWRGPLFSSLAAVAGGSMAELGAVSLFYSENLLPLPLLISRWMVKYRFEEAQGLAALLLLISFCMIGFSFALGGQGKASELGGVG